MATTTPSSNRHLKSTPVINNPQASPKPPGRNRGHEPRLSLKRVAGTTCSSPTGFDAVDRCFAYIAGGAAVVVDVDGGEHTQRFYRARPTAVPIFSVAPVQHGLASPNTTPKANDARNRAPRDASSERGGDSLTSKTWTSRERIKAATCVSLSRDGRFLAVGETGYAPRVLIFGLQDGSSSNQPLMSLSEHGYGVRAVAWSQDGKYLASLGTANDGFVFIWKVDPRNGSARFFQQNRCTAQVNGMVWLGNTLVTFGTRHVKAWKVDDVARPISPPKKVPGRELCAPDSQRTLPGRNVVLGSLLEASFTCALPLDATHALVCSDGGDVCLLDETNGQTKLTRVAELGYTITCCTRRGLVAVVGGKDGELATLDVGSILDLSPTPTNGESGLAGLTVMGVVQDQLVTIDPERSIDIWEAENLPNMSVQSSTRTRLAGQNDPILGIQSITKQEDDGPVFFTWSASGRVLLWDLNGRLKKSFDIIVDDCYTGNEKEPINQLCVVKADDCGQFFAAGDRVGVLRVVDHATGAMLLESKAHASEITHIAVHNDASKPIIATCGRDRTVQLYNRTPNGTFDLFQTLEFPARVTNLILSPDDKIITCSIDRNMQVHELVSKDDEPQALAAIHCRSIALKSTPTSLALNSNCRSIYVSSADRAVCQFDLESGRQMSCFKCTDEKGAENVVVESLIFGPSKSDEPSFLLGLSNTDKSVRIYDSNTGAFMDREWGHTESINGVALVDDRNTKTRNVVSIGCDGTIMIWDLNLRDPDAVRAGSRSPPPSRDANLGTSRPPLRRVLSKGQLAEFSRPSSSSGGPAGGDARRCSPPRTLRPRKSKQNMSYYPPSVRTPTNNNTSRTHQRTPSNSSTTATPSRRASSSRSGGTSPPPGPAPAPAPARAQANSSSPTTSSRLKQRRPSLPALGATPVANNTTARKKTSAINLRSSYGGNAAAAATALQTATEQTCRQLRVYRKKLITAPSSSSSSSSAAAETLAPEAAAELEAELRLTMAALAERAGGASSGAERQAVSESVLGPLLDQYSERLVSMLDERLRMRLSDAQGSAGGSGNGSENPGLLAPPIGDDRGAA